MLRVRKRRYNIRMKKRECLKLLVEQMHSSVIATVNEEGRPDTRVIDVMLEDGDSIYFLTAKGKAFYTQLMDQGYISLSATKDKKAVTVKGKILNIGQTKLDEIFEKNVYMQKIYPEGKRDALEVFRVEEGEMDYFNIQDPSHIERAHFSIGGQLVPSGGYYVNTTCILCGTCYAVCPQECIDTAKNPVVIDQNHCLHCGSCMSVCPVGAIERK